MAMKFTIKTPEGFDKELFSTSVVCPSDVKALPVTEESVYAEFMEVPVDTRRTLIKSWIDMYLNSNKKTE